MGNIKDRYVGCLLGGAIGDALGAPIEFMELENIRYEYGKQGVVEYVEYRSRVGEFTDDTQMTLFTAEALMRAYVRETEKGIGGALNTIAYDSYLRWLLTQGEIKTQEQLSHHGSNVKTGWLIEQKELFARRAPGITCLSSLKNGKPGAIDKPVNNSKGCGTIMRMAPVGLMIPNNERAFKVGCELSALTHGHPTGYLSAGFFASMIADLIKGLRVMEAVENAKVILKQWDHHEETLRAVDHALDFFHTTIGSKNEPDSGILEKLGGAWVAEEALAISLYCSLRFEDDFEKGVLFSVNHSGDSDSTGSITGNILGLIHGASSFPHQWMEGLKYHQLVIQVAEDLYNIRHGDYEKSAEEWWAKYPGG